MVSDILEQPAGSRPSAGAATEPSRAASGFRTIMVVTDLASDGEGRLRLAVSLADRFGAELIGVAASEIELPVFGAEYPEAAAEIITREEARATADLASAKTLFLREVGDRTNVEWLEAISWPQSFVQKRSCLADLVVMGRRGRDDAKPGPMELRPGDVVMSIGRPVLVVPPGVSELAARRVVIGWKDFARDPPRPFRQPALPRRGRGGDARPDRAGRPQERCRPCGRLSRAPRSSRPTSWRHGSRRTWWRKHSSTSPSQERPISWSPAPMPIRGRGNGRSAAQPAIFWTSGPSAASSRTERRAAMTAVRPARHRLGEAELRKLRELRTLRREQRKRGRAERPAMTTGQRFADLVAATIGSWRFILIQTVILLAWVFLNVTAYIQRWDPYPFILLNLALSFQAAYAAPFILMSQNRQQSLDRAEAANDYRVNVKAELEIELLHEKIDELRDKEVLALTAAVEHLAALLERGQEVGPQPARPAAAEDAPRMVEPASAIADGKTSREA